MERNFDLFTHVFRAADICLEVVSSIIILWRRDIIARRFVVFGGLIITLEAIRILLVVESLEALLAATLDLDRRLEDIYFQLVDITAFALRQLSLASHHTLLFFLNTFLYLTSKTRFKRLLRGRHLLILSAGSRFIFCSRTFEEF